MGFLSGRDTRFYDLFAEAGGNLVTATRLLEEVLAAAPEARPALAAKVKEVEHAGDDVSHRIYALVNSTFVTPFDREDIVALTSALDDVLDFVEEAADVLVLYRPGPLPEHYARFAAVLSAAALRTQEAMGGMASPGDLSEFWVEVNRLENEADDLYRQVLAHLFSGEFDTLEVMKLKEVVDQLEDAADAFEKVADVVHTIAAKES